MKAISTVTVLMLLCVCPALAQPSQMNDHRPMIAVNGEAVVNVKPDKVIITSEKEPGPAPKEKKKPLPEPELKSILETPTE